MLNFFTLYKAIYTGKKILKIFHWILFLLLSSSFFACDFLKTNPKEKSSDPFSRIFGESLFDYFQIHNQALDVLEALSQDGLLQKKPAVLIHFDSHSDMYRVSRKDDKSDGSYGQSYSSFINTLLLEGKVEEIYWVLPDETRTPENQEIFWNSEIGAEEYPVMFSGPRTQVFYVDERERDIYFDKPGGYDANPERYTKIKFHKVILEELMLEYNGKPVIIDIDADYFSNNGHDTANEMVVAYNEQSIARFLSALENLGVKPMLTMGSLSPDFTHDKDKLALERFFQDIGASTQKGDYLIGYKHHDKIGNMIVGNNIRRHSKELYRAIYEMRYIDLRTANPDYMAPIQDSSAECKQVKERIQRVLGVSAQKADTLLFTWDSEDGKSDSTIAYDEIEQNVQNQNYN